MTCLAVGVVGGIICACVFWALCIAHSKYEAAAAWTVGELEAAEDGTPAGTHAYIELGANAGDIAQRSSWSPSYDHDTTDQPHSSLTGN